jgi:UDP-3-O-[3-hydroxymyristoyl] glucosamine N-acyltransferase
MYDPNNTTLEAVLAALNRLGIPFSVEGRQHAITKVCSLLHKEPGGLYYYTGNDPSVVAGLERSMVLCRQEAAVLPGDNGAVVVEGDPQLIFYKLCQALFDTRPKPGIHSTAIIHPDAHIGEGVHIGAYAVVGRCSIGEGAVIQAHVVIMDGCVIGRRVQVESNSCLGATGVAWVWGENGERIVLPQLGKVVIEDDVFLGTDVTIVRGMFNEATTIGQGSMIAHGSKVGHSVVMGRDCHVANNVSIAGSARIGDKSFLGAGCSIRPHTTLADGTIVGVGAAVVKDVTEPGAILAGVPAKELPRKERPSGMPAPQR